jgi:3-phosphoshikimate 1-carboxyvinyltransferase
MVIEEGEDFLKVPENQVPDEMLYEVEPDMSSTFTLGAFAFFNGKLVLESFPEKSLQPDFIFTDLLREMGAELNYELEDKKLVVKKAQTPQNVNWNLRNNPDLFPVLAVLLSRVPGESSLSGLEALAFKESHRLDNIVDLLSELGFKCSVQNKKFVIKGESDHNYPQEPLSFDPDQDHRMAMAAALACYQGASIEISHPEVVNKSFPEFWEILKV